MSFAHDQLSQFLIILPDAMANIKIIGQKKILKSVREPCNIVPQGGRMDGIQFDLVTARHEILHVAFLGSYILNLLSVHDQLWW